MPNNYFQFKQFIIHQDKTSMKVCTDACLFGSWIAKKVTGYKLPVASCLDIGTGTGLLSLMLAQKSDQVRIDALEMEENAYQQAKENFKISKWNDRLRVIKTDAKEFMPGEKYDLLITNPPFYENDLLSQEKNKNLSKHNTGLTMNELIIVIKNNLKADGKFAILLPYSRIAQVKNIALENNFILNERLLIRQTPAHNFFRGILLFSSQKTQLTTSELTIKNKEGNYTDEFIELLKDYYLHFSDT